jgi:ABC-type glycerol-3-phosphate transport system substrate-binding protein
MKKKYRDITVNDKQYAWAVQNDTLVIWYNKKIVQMADVLDTTVTPKIVAEIIKNLQIITKLG